MQILKHRKKNYDKRGVPVKSTLPGSHVLNDSTQVPKISTPDRIGNKLKEKISYFSSELPKNKFSY